MVDDRHERTAVVPGRGQDPVADRPRRVVDLHRLIDRQRAGRRDREPVDADPAGQPSVGEHLHVFAIDHTEHVGVADDHLSAACVAALAMAGPSCRSLTKYSNASSIMASSIGTSRW